jgi:hypothetical protein
VDQREDAADGDAVDQVAHREPDAALHAAAHQCGATGLTGGGRDHVLVGDATFEGGLAEHPGEDERDQAGDQSGDHPADQQ